MIWNRTRALCLVLAFLGAACAQFGGSPASAQTPSNATPGYFNFDLHASGGSGSNNQIIFGSAYVASGPISGNYNIALDYNTWFNNQSSYSGYMVTGSFTSDATGYASSSGPITFAPNTPLFIQTMGLGCGTTGQFCGGAGDANAGTETYAMRLGFDPTNGKGWFISDAAFGFTANNGVAYWIEGGSTSGGTAGLDIHAATQVGARYASSTSGTNTTLESAPKVECMTNVPITDTYCLSLTNSQVNPEINAATLPKSALLLASLYIVAMRFRLARSSNI
jgi:hypothetical protein